MRTPFAFLVLCLVALSVLGVLFGSQLTRDSLEKPTLAVPTSSASPLRPSSTSAISSVPSLKPTLPSRRSTEIPLKTKDFPMFQGYSDFVAYTVPNTSSLLSVPTWETPFPLRNHVKSYDIDEVTSQYPCTTLKPSSSSEASSSLIMYVPWGSLRYMTQSPLHCPSTEGSACQITNNVNQIPKASIYVVDTLNSAITEPYNWRVNPQKKTLVAWNVENIDGRGKVLRQSYKSRYMGKNWTDSWWDSFDISVSYQMSSMIFMSYYHWANCRDPNVLYARSTTTTSKKYADSPVLFFASNCDFVSHRRMGFVRELMKHIGVDALGKCLNNKHHESVPFCRGVKENRKNCIMSHYYFYLAIENSISLDYVTEKVYEPLMVGTVPVYLGAPNSANFFPTNRSVIVATDFSSVKQLAQYMKCLIQNPDLYQKYVSWQTRPAYASWKTITTTSPPLCQVCELAQKKEQFSNWKPLARPRVFPRVFEENAEGQKPFSHCLK